MAINRFSPIQGLPEWQPQVPLEMLSKALVYKQELFDKNLNIIKSDISAQNTIADNILNNKAKEEYSSKINNFKNSLNTNYAFADLTDDTVLSSIGNDMSKVIDDPNFEAHVLKSNTIRDGIRKYKEAREKGNTKDNFYTGAQEALSMDTYNDYINSEDPNQALKVSIRGFKQDLDINGLMQDALKDIGDFKDKNIQLTEMGWMYRLDKYSTVDQQKIMNRLQPILSRADVQDQLYADAYYRYRDNPNIILNQSIDNFKNKISTLEQQNRVFEKNIIANHGNAEAIAYNSSLIEENKKRIESYQKDLIDQQRMVTSIKPDQLTKEDKLVLRNLGKQLYTEQVINPFVQSFAISEHDIELKENPQKKAEFDAAQSLLRLQTEYDLKLRNSGIERQNILGEQQTFTVTEDLEDKDFDDSKIQEDISTYTKGMNNSKAALARALQEEYENQLTDEELKSPKRWLFMTSNGGFNMGNVDYWIKNKTLKGLSGSLNVTTLNTSSVDQHYNAYNDNRIKLASITEAEKKINDKIVAANNVKIGNTDLRSLYNQYGSKLYVTKEQKIFFTAEEKAKGGPSSSVYTTVVNESIKNEIIKKYGEDAFDKLVNLYKRVENSNKSSFRKEIYGTHTGLGLINMPGVYNVSKDGTTREVSNDFVSYLNNLAKNQNLSTRFDKSTISSIRHEKRSDGKTYHIVTIGSKFDDKGQLIGGQDIELEDNDVTNSKYKIKNTAFYNRVGQYALGDKNGSIRTPSGDAGLIRSSNGQTSFSYSESANGVFQFNIKGVDPKSKQVTYRTSLNKYFTNNYSGTTVTQDQVLEAIDWISNKYGDIGLMTEDQLVTALKNYNNK